MLDAWARPKIDPALVRLARMFRRAGVSADLVTVSACLVGFAAAAAIAWQAYLLGLVLILVSRLGDGLDGALARLTAPTDRGGYLDIVLDFAFYGAVPLGFVLADPGANGVAGAVLLFAFYVNGASFLAYAVLAEKRGLKEEERGAKSFLFSVGLAEATETLIAFVLMCLFPAAFAAIAYVFAAMTAVTTLSRIASAVRDFG